MTVAIRWTTRASTQLEESALYLEEARSGAGTDFIEHAQKLLEIAADHPLAFPKVPKTRGADVRRGLVRKYGYWIIYEQHETFLLVLSVWHGARRPEGWRLSP